MSFSRSPDAPPSRTPWPPILIAATIGAGLALDAATRNAWGALPDFGRARPIGVAIALAAFAIEFWCARTLARHETTILPHRAARALATDGPYRWSRNPIYVAHLALVVAAGLIFAAPFILALTPVLALAILKLAIEPEERHLMDRFAGDYRAYLAQTPRWL